MPQIGKNPSPPPPSVNGKPRKTLTLPQARILDALSTKRGPVNRAAIVDAVSSPGRATAIGDSMGYVDDQRRLRRDAEVGHPSLITQGFVREVELDLDGTTETGYEITDAGRRALSAFGTIPPLRSK
jgi:hypothetical protein